jgi:lysophospholipase L1-like esterase
MRAMMAFSLALALVPAARAQTANVFEPAFHQALRWSVSTATRTTYRTTIPVGRGGGRLRVSFKAGDGSLVLHAATVALAGTQGQLASAPIALAFGGSPSATLATRARITSDPIDLAVSAATELYVSFDVDGAMAASNINAFPDSYSWSGSVASVQAPTGGVPFMRAAAVDTIDVEGPKTSAMVALGDSITEGYIGGDVGNYVSRNDDYRDAWPAVAQGLTGLPIVNAAVSGQGVFDAASHLDSEVFTLQGITDCVVLIGTNDLGGNTADQIDAGLEALFVKLRPFCGIWVATLLPKETTTNGVYATVVQRRIAVNDWIRHQAQVKGVIDFEPVVALPGDINHFAPGLGADGIHPTAAGHRLLGQEAARVLSVLVPPDGPKIETIQPTSGSSAGGTVVEISGANFAPGTTLTIGGVPAVAVTVSSTGTLSAKTGPHASGTADIVVTSPTGVSATLATGFTYTDQASVDPTPPTPTPTTQGKTGCNGSGSPASFLLFLPFFGFVVARRRVRALS